MNEILQALLKFRDERNWKQFHTPENLAKSIVIESCELLENFQWESQDADNENVKDELADIMTYCLYMCDYYGFDFEKILTDKMMKNEIKYPKEKSYGNSKKYNKL